MITSFPSASKSATVHICFYFLLKAESRLVPKEVKACKYLSEAYRILHQCHPDGQLFRHFKTVKEQGYNKQRQLGARINTVMKYCMYIIMRNNMTHGFWDSGYIDYLKSFLPNCTWNFLRCFETSQGVCQCYLSLLLCSEAHIREPEQFSLMTVLFRASYKPLRNRV